ncbi:MAG TPA: hypothetical protein VIH90_03695 [Candidatus Saccharimonadales bacterium]
MGTQSEQLDIHDDLIDDADFDGCTERETLGLCRVGTLVEMVGRTAAQPALDRMAIAEKNKLESFRLYD